MDVLGSRWAKVAIFLTVGLSASSVGAKDRRAEVLIQRWGDAIKAAGPIAGRFTTYEFYMESKRFGEGAGVFRRDEQGRLSVTVSDMLHEAPSALHPFNDRNFPTSNGRSWSQCEFPAYTFTEEEDGWYSTIFSSDGREIRLRVMGLPSALEPSNTQNGLRNFFLFSTPEMTATGVFSVPLLLPTLKGIEYVRPQTVRVSSDEMIVRCGVFIPEDPELRPESTWFLPRRFLEVVATFRRGSPYPREIILERFLGPSRTVSWVFHDLEYDSR